jgi:hypothetical protein
MRGAINLVYSRIRMILVRLILVDKINLGLAKILLFEHSEFG